MHNTPYDRRTADVLGVSTTAAFSAFEGSFFVSGTIKPEAGLSPLLL